MERHIVELRLFKVEDDEPLLTHIPLKICPYCETLLPPVYLAREVNGKKPL